MAALVPTGAVATVGVDRARVGTALLAADVQRATAVTLRRPGGIVGVMEIESPLPPPEPELWIDEGRSDRTRGSKRGRPGRSSAAVRVEAPALEGLVGATRAARLEQRLGEAATAFAGERYVEARRIARADREGGSGPPRGPRAARSDAVPVGSLEGGGPRARGLPAS